MERFLYKGYEITEVVQIGLTCLFGRYVMGLFGRFRESRQAIQDLTRSYEVPRWILEDPSVSDSEVLVYSDLLWRSNKRVTRRWAGPRGVPHQTSDWDPLRRRAPYWPLHGTVFEKCV